MRALVVDHRASEGVVLRDVPDACAHAGQMLIRIRASSINFGELPTPGTPAGVVPGWDGAGVVEQASEHETGHPPGTRVVTWARAGGGWAQSRAVELDETAVIPDDVTFAQAATLPVSAVTALRALRFTGSLLAKRVMVTGATGGVGGFAVQLAHLSGAVVTAFARDERHATELHRLGADEVVTDSSQVTCAQDAVIDNVGGPLLAEIVARLAPDARVLLVGSASKQPVHLPPMALTLNRIHLIGFQKGAGTRPDLELLLRLVSEGRLETSIGWQHDWSRFDEASTGLRTRSITGKAVLEIA